MYVERPAALVNGRGPLTLGLCTADTLEAYIDRYTGLVPFLADDAEGVPPSDAPPAEQISKAISLQVCFSLLVGLGSRH